MIQNDVRWNRQCVIEESLFDDISLLGILIINFRELLIMQWNLIPFDKIVVEMDRQDLRVLERFFGFLREILMVDILLNIWVPGRRLVCALLMLT